MPNPRNTSRLLALLFAVLASLSAERAFGGEEEGGERAKDQPALLKLWLNEVERDDVFVVMRGEDIWVKASDLQAAGLRVERGRKETILEKTMVSLASLDLLDYQANERALTLSIKAPAEMLPSSVIDMRHGSPQGIVYRQDASGFLNYTATLTDLRHPSGFVEAGVSIGGALFSSTLTASEYSGVVRGLSSLVVDDRKRLERWTLGDTFVTSGDLGAGLFMGGLSVSRNFSIDPYFVSQPSLGYSGSALTPSKLDVYVNGVRTRTVDIAPGAFRVQDVPLQSGSGNVRFVLRDAFGHEHSVDSPYSMVGTQLGEGRSDFTYAAGFRRHNVGTESFDYRQFGVLGKHRFGVTNHVTLGGRLEATPERVSGGATIQVLLPHGYASLSGGASYHAAGEGFAGALRFGFQYRRWSVMGMAQVATDRYVTLSLDPEQNRNRYEARVATMVSTTKRLSFSSDAWLLVPRDEVARFRVGASMQLMLAPKWSLNVNASRTMLGDSTSSAEVMLQLVHTFENGIMAAAGARAIDAHPEGFVNVNKPQVGSTGVSARASLIAREHPSGDALVQYVGAHGRYQASGSIDEAGPHLALDVSGAIVAMRGAGVFLTAPIQQSFAVIHVPGVKGVHGYLENRDAGTTNKDGDLVLPNLSAYYGSRVRISDHDLPLDYAIDTTEKRVAPPLRGGALLVFSAKRTRYHRGHLRVEAAGALTTPSYGELEVETKKGPITSPVGKDGEFELQDVEPGVRRAKVVYEGGACAFSLHVKDDEKTITDLGMLLCKVK